MQIGEEICVRHMSSYREQKWLTARDSNWGIIVYFVF
jgi:hypothetical protein